MIPNFKIFGTKIANPNNLETFLEFGTLYYATSTKY